MGVPVRHRDFGGPSWLWTALENDYENGGLGQSHYVANIEDPEKLFRIKKYRGFFRNFNKFKNQASVLMTSYPSIYTASATWSDVTQTSFRWIVEAMIMAGATDKEIAWELGKDEVPETITAYRELFFDLEGNEDRLGYMSKWVWGPAEANTEYYLVDLVYKIAAKYGSREHLASLLHGFMTYAPHKTWFQDVVKYSRLRHALQFASTYVKLDVCSKANVTERIIDEMGRNPEKAEEGSKLIAAGMDELSSEMHSLMGVFDMDMELGSKEEITADMYADKDIKKDTKNG